jgi:LacI family transcriptional regulator
MGAKTVAKLRDVAAAAGLSAATVSRHQNGTIVLPPATVARIEEAIRTLGYQPNPHARRLSLGRSDSIGLVVPDIANPFFARLAAAVEQAADAVGLSVVLNATLNQPRRELAYLQRMRLNHLDGLIFITNHGDDGQLVKAINAAKGVVLMDEDVPKARGHKVFCDNAHGGFLAGRHLIENGHRDLVYVGGPADLMSAVERLQGFRQAVQEAAPARVLAELFGPYSAAHGRAAADKVLAMSPRPTGVFAGSDEIALGLLARLKEAGVRVPDEVSLIGFDDVGPLDLFDPPLTSVRQPIEKLGQCAVELLRSPQGKLSEVRLPVELAVRGSVTTPMAAGGRFRVTQCTISSL